MLFKVLFLFQAVHTTDSRHCYMVRYENGTVKCQYEFPEGKYQLPIEDHGKNRVCMRPADCKMCLNFECVSLDNAAFPTRFSSNCDAYECGWYDLKCAWHRYTKCGGVCSI